MKNLKIMNTCFGKKVSGQSCVIWKSLQLWTRMPCPVMSNGSTKCHAVLGRTCTSTCQRSLVCEKSKIININSLQCLLMLQLWTICPFYIFHEQTAATLLHFQVFLRHSDNPCLFKCILVKSWCQVPRIKKVSQAPVVMMRKALGSAKLPHIRLTDALCVVKQWWSCSHFGVGCVQMGCICVTKLFFAQWPRFREPDACGVRQLNLYSMAC